MTTMLAAPLRSRTHWLAPLVMLGLWTACGDGSLVHIDIDGSDKVTVQGGNVLEDLVGDLGFDGFTNINLVDSQKLKNQGVEPGDISTARLVSFELELLEPEDGDLSFIDSFEIWVESPGLEPVLIAEAQEFPDGETYVSFDVMDVDLVDYVVSESMTFSTDISANSPREDSVVQASYVIDVGVTLQGAKNQACN
jgi:hypothetical protein